MTKTVNWRISCPAEVRINQMIALETETFFVLRQNGPLSFTVQDLEHEKPYEVRLGDPHFCSCRSYKSSQEICSHICWIILKKFKISYRDPLSFQRGISAREIGNLFAEKPLVGRVHKLPKIQMQNRPTFSQVPRKNCGPGDTCAICLEQFASRDNVTHCKYSCGNVVHIRCIQMLIKHTDTQNNDNKVENDIQMLKCPLCRGNFNTLSDLKIIVLKASRNPLKSQPLQEHPFTCAFCRTKPIRGNLYRCLDCTQILLCGVCLKTQDFLVYHKTHNYAVKKKSGGPWRRLGKVEEHLKAFNTNGNFLLSSSSFSSTANRRNATEYKNLLEFSKGFSFNCDEPDRSDNDFKNKTNAIKTDRHFVKRNYLCAVCTDAFEVNTYILATTCGHYFHSDCMEEHMNDSINEKRCPLDNIQIHYSPLNRHKPIKWSEKPPPKKETDEINLGPLEVRVSRMHLEQRPKDSSKGTVAASNTHYKTTTTKQSKHRVKLTHKECKPIVQHEESNLDERLLSAKVNPLMTILMSPHLKQYIEQEEKRDQPNDANTKRKSLNKIKVKSLEFPDESNAGRVAKLQKSRSTPSPSHWVQKTLKCKIADGQTRPIKRCDL